MAVRQSTTPTLRQQFSKEYQAWKNMKARCNNRNCAHFADYGGRGIRVCTDWLDSFEAFFRHIGQAPSALHSVDRINNDRNYEPGNVRWLVMAQQVENTRVAHRMEYRGQCLSLAKWSRLLGIPKNTIRKRLASGWKMEDVLDTKLCGAPIGKRKIPSGRVHCAGAARGSKDLAFPRENGNNAVIC